MIKNDTFAKITGLGIFYRWHPAIAMRYLPFVETINKISKDHKILEVGSGGLGIAPYLGREITGVDINFQPPFHPLLHKIKGSCTKLPFPTSSFDIVLNMDMLEHLEKGDRIKAISEMIRVARIGVYIGVPTGKLASAQDIELNNYYKYKFNKEYKFFEEQISEGLPEKEDIINMILTSAKKLQKKVKIRTVGNESITLHKILMKGWMTKNILADIFYRKIMLFFIPLLRLFDDPPYYRQLYFVEIHYEDSN